jgi:hypothetical protein
VPKQLDEVSTLGELGDAMMQIEKQRLLLVKGATNPAEADRNAAQMGLIAIASFLANNGIESKPVIRLLAELSAITDGSRLSDMLTPDVSGHRPVEPGLIDGMKGRLAAVMEYRQRRGGLARKAAAASVARHLPKAMKLRLRSPQPSTVASWLSKWGGERGATAGPGREGYLSMRSILHGQELSEPQIRGIIDSLAGYVPPAKSK